MTGLCGVLFGYAMICLITNVYSQADPYDDTDDKDTESSGSGTLSVIILFVVIAKFIFLLWVLEVELRKIPSTTEDSDAYCGASGTNRYAPKYSFTTCYLRR